MTTATGRTPAKKGGKKTTAKKGATTPRRAPATQGVPVPAVSAEELEQLQAEIDAELAEAGDASPIGPDGEIRPVIIGRTGSSGPEKVHIFSIDDVDYHIPKNPNAAVMLTFLREARSKRVGQDLAVMNAMVTMLGQDAMDALMESQDVSDEDCAKVFTIVAHILFGAVKRWQAAAAPRRAG